MAEPNDIMLSILREMRAENAAGFASVSQRLEKLEEAHVTFRHALSADSLLSKSVTGEFEERIELLERKV